MKNQRRFVETFLVLTGVYSVEESLIKELNHIFSKSLRCYIDCKRY
jgi:predicted HicB family RNase H-like nuclease